MQRSRKIAIIVGTLLGLASAAACTADEDATQTCTEHVQDLADEKGEDVDGYETFACGMLGLDSDAQYTQQQFDDAVKEFESQDDTEALSEDTDSPETEMKPGMQLCEDWATEKGDDADAVCYESDIWPDTPLYEDEYDAYVEVTECWDYWSTHSPGDARYEECDELTSNPPTLDELRG